MSRWASLPLLILAFAPQAQAQGTHSPALTIASVELPAGPGEWQNRRDEILSMMQTLQPDVIAVQQVLQLPDKLNPACWMATQLRYSCVFVTADPPSQPQRRGNAMLTRRAVIEDGVTLLHPPGQFSAAGMLRLQLDQGPVNVYVVRLRPEENSVSARRHQTHDLLAWIAATADGLPSLIAGDFAASTDELVRQLPGFQPARRNPTGKHAESAAPPATTAAGHGLDVLYQVRQFADIARQPLQLPGADPKTPPLRLGVMATVQLTAAAVSEPPDSPAP
ncbi:MAG: endonuclease/exonuclease/phosphatase family protein [Stenotrophomonas sp.]